jgi:hypothetical protein
MTWVNSKYRWITELASLTLRTGIHYCYNTIAGAATKGKEVMYSVMPDAPKWFSSSDSWWNSQEVGHSDLEDMLDQAQLKEDLIVSE